MSITHIDGAHTENSSNVWLLSPRSSSGRRAQVTIVWRDEPVD